MTDGHEWWVARGVTSCISSGLTPNSACGAGSKARTSTGLEAVDRELTVEAFGFRKGHSSNPLPPAHLPGLRHASRPSRPGRFRFAHASMERRGASPKARLATTAARRGTGWRPIAMPLTNRSSPSFLDLRPGWLEVVDVASLENVNDGPSFTSNENYHTTLDVLFVGCRVCIRRKPRTCGEVVRVMPMAGRVVVRLDPPHPSWRGTLRSFRPERLVIYS